MGKMRWVGEKKTQKKREKKNENLIKSERYGKNGCVTYGENEMGGREKNEKKTREDVKISRLFERPLSLVTRGITLE